MVDRLLCLQDLRLGLGYLGTRAQYIPEYECASQNVVPRLVSTLRTSIISSRIHVRLNHNSGRIFRHQGLCIGPLVCPVPPVQQKRRKGAEGEIEGVS